MDKKKNPAPMGRKTFNVPRDLISYIPQALSFFGVHEYSVTRSYSGAYLTADISGRLYRRVERKAHALCISEERGMKHLCREDVGNYTSGVILAQEKWWFDRAAL